MATVENDSWARPESIGFGHSRPPESQPMHRVSAVREQQGLSLRSAARQLGTEIRELRRQEMETTDLRLSDLYRWQRVLGVPVSELLVEPSSVLSHPIMERAQLVRIMKTVKSLFEVNAPPAVERLAATLVNQLVEIMPELEEVGPWHSVGQRRSLNEYGRAAERTMSDELFNGTEWDYGS
jgi:transcriptional regulator with XRE-family HTH domain